MALWYVRAWSVRALWGTGRMNGMRLDGNACREHSVSEPYCLCCTIYRYQTPHYFKATDTYTFPIGPRLDSVLALVYMRPF